MTLLQTLRGIFTTDPHIASLCSTKTTFEATSTAEQFLADWDGSTIRDQLFRDAATRVAVRVDHAAVSCVWRFADRSGLVANYEGIFVL